MNRTVVTVFGGTGFLGRRIVQHLVKAGMQVRVAARTPRVERFEGHEEQVVPVTVDIRDDNSVAAAVSGAGAVVNAVSLYVEKGSLTFDAIHVRGAERVARQAQSAGVERLVHVSGIGVDVNSPSPFIRARARGEEVVRVAFREPTIIRPSVMFACDDAFLSSLEKVTRLPVVPLFGQGQTRLQPAYAEDVAEAITRIISAGDYEAKVFELGGGKIYRYRDAVQAVAKHLGRKRVLASVPFPVWHGMAAAMGILPKPPLTRDQLALLETDNVATPGAKSFPDLGIEPRSLESVLNDCYPRD